jgi:hypothetical protein
MSWQTTWRSRAPCAPLRFGLGMRRPLICSRDTHSSKPNRAGSAATASCRRFNRFLWSCGRPPAAGGRRQPSGLTRQMTSCYSEATSSTRRPDRGFPNRQRGALCPAGVHDDRFRFLILQTCECGVVCCVSERAGRSQQRLNPCWPGSELQRRKQQRHDEANQSDHKRDYSRVRSTWCPHMYSSLSAGALPV